MNKLMKSVSGIRGVFGESITPENITKFAAQFAYFQKNRHTEKNQKIIVGRDSRTTGDALAHAVMAGILSVGLDVIYLGIVSTPTVLLTVKELEAIGGIVITASHNPAEWNAMKFVDQNGMFLFPEIMNNFLCECEKNNYSYANWDAIGSRYDYFDATWMHIQKILSIPYLNLEDIRNKNYKVVIDSVNGAGGVISPTLLRELGCDVIEINSEPTGYFAHPPEPLAKNLEQICLEVKKNKADIGFATDPDVDRLVIVDESGCCIGEEYSLLLAEKFVLKHKKGDIVTNLSSSIASDDIASEYGVKVVRTAIGEIHVGKMMLEIDSPIGGEGNGGIICPEVNYTRDAVTGMALILGYITERGLKISELVNEIPKYFIAKDKIDADIENIFEKVVDYFKEEKIDCTDGVKISFKKAWVHIRKSGTEPIIRIYAEAETQTEAYNLIDKVKDAIKI